MSDRILLTTPRVVRSEWLKLRTIRSTWWCGALVVALSVLFAVLIATAVNRSGGRLGSGDDLAVRVITAGTNLTQLIAAVLGVLVISGEYATGMIRSTFTAVPRRLPAMLAKLGVLMVTMFVLGLLAVGLGTAATAGILSGHGADPHLGDAAVWMPLVGAALYLALVAALAFSVGALLRNTAAGIATVLGLLLVVPILVNIAVALTQATWVQSLAALLPASAGGQLYTYAAKPAVPAPADVLVLNGWGGLGVMLAWVLVALIPALVLVRRRDA